MRMQTILLRKAEIMTADMNGSTVMMDIETGKYYNLGDVGGEIWKLLQEPLCLNELMDKLMAQYDVSREQCETDIIPFLQQLIDSGLLVEERK